MPEEICTNCLGGKGRKHDFKIRSSLERCRSTVKSQDGSSKSWKKQRGRDLQIRLWYWHCQALLSSTSTPAQNISRRMWMSDQSGSPHFGCVKLSAGEGRFAMACAQQDVTLDPPSPIESIKICYFHPVIGKLGLGLWILKTHKKKTWNQIPHHRSLFTCLTFEPPPKKGGWHLDPPKFTTEAPCPDYGFLGYFINVRNLPGDTGKETVGREILQLIRFSWQRTFQFQFCQWGNVSPRLEACSTFHCHVLLSCAMWLLSFANCSPNVLLWKFRTRITFGAWSPELWKPLTQMCLQDFNWRKPLQAAAPPLFALDFPVRDTEMDQNPHFVASNWDLLNVSLDNFNSTAFLISLHPLTNSFQASKAIPSAPEWLNVLILKVVRRNSYSHCRGFSFSNLWCLCFLCWNLCICLHRWLDVNSRCNIHVPMRRHTPSLGLKKAPRGCQTQHLHYQPDPLKISQYASHEH